MKKLEKIVLLFGIIFSCATYAKTHKLIDNYDLRYYYPKNFGLKDLSFEVRIDGLEKKLTEGNVFPRLVDVFAKVYWVFPGKFDLEILGLPKGFTEKKLALKEFISNRLDFILTKSLAERMEDYSFKEVSRKGGSSLFATDRTYKKTVSKATLKFSNKGKLVEYKDFSPAGSRFFKIKMAPTPWTDNKWAYKSISQRSFTGIVETITSYNFKYQKVVNFNVPKELGLVIEQKATGRNVKDSPKQSFLFKFSNYAVNQNVAKKYFKSAK